MIVEFIDERAFSLGLALEVKPHRLTLFSRDGRSVNVSQNRILNTFESGDPGDKAGRAALLSKTASELEAAARKIDLAELWEILEGEGPEFDYASLAELHYGYKPGPKERSAMMRAVFADNLLFRFGPEGVSRNSAEEVEILRARRSRAEREERLAEAVSAWIKEAAAGRLAPEPDEGADEGRAALLDLALWGDEARLKQSARDYLRRAGLAADAQGAFQALAALGVFTRHENLDLRRLGLPENFSPETMRAADKLSAVGSSRDGRRDLTELPTMTIDSSGARDLDDALSVKALPGGGWQVAVHITDVAAFIPRDSELDMEARARASSIYLPEAKYPMLPVSLSEGLFSLTLGDVRPAFSICMKVGPEGEVESREFTPSLIKVDRQLTFNEVDQTLDEDSDLVELWDLSQALLRRREAAGGVNLNLPKLNIYFTPDGRLAHSLTRWDTSAKIMVGELMILANHLAADSLKEGGFACPYRFQEPASAPMAPPAEGDDENTLLCKRLAARRQTGRSGLSFSPTPHHGLGLSTYTAFTAPMRRYIDLLVGRQLRALGLGGEAAYGEQELMRLVLPAYDLQQRIQKMQSRRQRYWLCTLLAEKVGQEFSGLVFEQRDRRLRVCIPEYMHEFDLFTPKGEGRPPDMFGRKVGLKLIKADARDDALRFELL